MSIPTMNMYSDQLIQSELRYMNRDRYQSLRLLRTDNTAQVKQFVASETIRQISLTRKKPSTTSCNIEDMTTNPLRRQKYQVSSGKDADPTRSSGRESPIKNRVPLRNRQKQLRTRRWEVSAECKACRAGPGSRDSVLA